MNVSDISKNGDDLLKSIKELKEKYLNRIEELTIELNKILSSGKSQQFINDQTQKIQREIDEIKVNLEKNIKKMEKDVKDKIEKAIENKKKTIAANLSAKFGIEIPV